MQKASKLFMPTLRQVPADAEIASHRLLLRAGMTRKVASGVYTYLPLGLRALNKVKAVVRRHMDGAGALELEMPILQPAEMWQSSGRWAQYGPEMMRLKDRHEREFCLGPTHEELITKIVDDDVASYKQLPLTLYQIQTKFRDEIRPRFGTMRLREFCMKDAYSFDADEAGLQVSFDAMEKAYSGLLEELGLEYRVVSAASGLIGGDVSKEFMVVADVGEDTIVYCTCCSYSANMEVATAAAARPPEYDSAPGEMRAVPTPGLKSVADVAAALEVPPAGIVKTLLYWTPNGTVAVLLRGDHKLNENKLMARLGVEKAFLLDPKAAEAQGLVPGFFGPVGLPSDIELIADEAVAGLDRMVVGANQPDAHLIDVVPGRDLTIESTADLRLVEDGDACQRCGGRMRLTRGIEMGHIFQLGTKYSQAMNATFLNEEGKPVNFVMGCYGIGVDRLLAAAVEQNHDDKGIIWPAVIAPYHVHILVLNNGDEAAMKIALEKAELLEAAGYEVLLDERNVSAGVKFGDADLLGLPVRINLGRSLKEGNLELVDRHSGATQVVPVGDGDALLAAIGGILAG